MPPCTLIFNIAVHGSGMVSRLLAVHGTVPCTKAHCARWHGSNFLEYVGIFIKNMQIFIYLNIIYANVQGIQSRTLHFSKDT